MLAVRATFLSPEVVGKPGAVAKALILLSIVLLLALSFRTYPVLELYHWEAYVGPVQEVRQGGWLLWDAPAQYGVLSILIPTLFPGNAWQSFYIFQSICNAVVALLMFWGLGGTPPSVSRIILAASLTATTLFFRPRSATLLLAAQMTPSGGPVRFIWPFVMLAFLFHHYRANQGKVAEPSAERRFENTCHLIWLGSLCWSLESGIYCSAVWFPAYAIILMHRITTASKNGQTPSQITRMVLRSLAVPIGAVVLIVALTSGSYALILGHRPDWMSYLEYALLYSGGFHALLLDPSGSIWFF